MRREYTEEGLSESELMAKFDEIEHNVRMVLRGAEATDEQRQLLGSLLGDASISSGEYRSYRVQISHSEKQFGYAKHLGDILGSAPRP